MLLRLLLMSPKTPNYGPNLSVWCNFHVSLSLCCRLKQVDIEFMKELCEKVGITMLLMQHVSLSHHTP